jgi:hypothetical protein
MKKNNKNKYIVIPKDHYILGDNVSVVKPTSDNIQE